MHFTWLSFLVFAALLITACIVTARLHALIVRHRVVWLHQEMAHAPIRQTARVACECCRRYHRHMVAYTYGHDERAPRIAYVCRRCDQVLQQLRQAASARTGEEGAS